MIHKDGPSTAGVLTRIRHERCKVISFGNLQTRLKKDDSTYHKACRNAGYWMYCSGKLLVKDVAVNHDIIVKVTKMLGHRKWQEESPALSVCVSGCEGLGAFL